MTVQQIPLKAVASQVMSVQLGGQLCTIAVYQKSTGLYADLSVSDAPVVTGVVCEDRNPLVRGVYLGFVGDLYFVDTQGTTDPQYLGLADRYQFLWDSALGA